MGLWDKGAAPLPDLSSPPHGPASTQSTLERMLKAKEECLVCRAVLKGPDFFFLKDRP